MAAGQRRLVHLPVDTLLLSRRHCRVEGSRRRAACLRALLEEPVQEESRTKGDIDSSHSVL